MDFPNLPYLIHGDLKITESRAIYRYICNTYAPDLLGKNPAQKAQVDMVYMVIKDIKAGLDGFSYRSGDKEGVV